jgi:hypothetical protein
MRINLVLFRPAGENMKTVGTTSRKPDPNKILVKIFIVNQVLTKVLSKIHPFFLGTSPQLKLPLHSLEKRVSPLIRVNHIKRRRDSAGFM